MNVDLIFKIAAIGILVSVLNQVLSRSGRDEQATMTTLAGLVVVLMIRFIDAFKVFDTVYVMTNGGPGSATEMLPNYIYKQGLKFFDAGYAAALAIVFVLTMTLCTTLFLRWRKREEDKL